MGEYSELRLHCIFYFENNHLHEEDCGAFLGDRICNDVFNTIKYLYDEGDCCGLTCTGPTCGLGNMKLLLMQLLLIMMAIQLIRTN